MRSGSLAAVILTMGSIAALTVGQAVDLTSPINTLGEWVRLAVTVIALFIAAYVIYKHRNEKAKDETIEALKNAVEAHRLECEALAKRLKSVEEEKLKIDAECIALRAKTDMSEVLKMITALNAAVTKEHTQSMEIIQVMLKTMVDQLLQNKETLDEIVGIVSGWKIDRRDAIRKKDLHPKR